MYITLISSTVSTVSNYCLTNCGVELVIYCKNYFSVEMKLLSNYCTIITCMVTL